MRDELPHSLAVVIEEVIDREDRRDDQPPMVDVHAILYVERDSQKGIIIGRRVPGSKKWARPHGRRSKSCWAPRCTWTCTSRWPRTGNATPNSCGAWDSDPCADLPG